MEQDTEDSNAQIVVSPTRGSFHLPQPGEDLPVHASERSRAVAPLLDVTLANVLDCVVEIETRNATIAEHMTAIQEERRLVEKARQRICDLRAAHNAAVAIHAKLPTEVLMEIFRHLHPSSRTDIQVTHVCQHWRSIILQIPDFWVDFVGMSEFFEPRPWLYLTGEVVDRTYPRSYGLKIHDWSLHHVSCGVYLSRSQMTRLSSLTIVLAEDYLRAEYHMSHLKMPDLTELTLRFEPSDTRSAIVGDLERQVLQMPSPKPEQYPQLHRLTTLASFLTPLLPVSLLTHLHASGHVVSPEAFLPVLGTCQTLETLQLSWPSCNTEHPDHIDPITLPRLKEWFVHVKVEHLPWLQFLLTHVSYPDTANLVICSISCSVADILVGLPPTSSMILINSLSLCFYLNMTGNLGTIYVVGSSNGSPRLELILKDASWGPSRGFCGPSAVVADVMRLISPAVKHSLTSLRCDWPGVAATRDDWTLLLQSVPHLTDLTLSVVSCRNIFRVLRKLPVCPNLKRLRVQCINGKGVQEEVVATLEARAARSMLLRFLAFRTLGGLSEPRRERLKAIVEVVLIEVYSRANESTWEEYHDATSEA